MERDVDTGDAMLRVQLYGSAGPDGAARPWLICAHGFPDNERGFRHQIAALTGAGHRLAIPTMRGYSPSSASRSGKYDAAALSRDILAIAQEISPDEPVHLFGHDWGAIACYAAAAASPRRVAKLITAAVPHMRVAGPRWSRPSQLKRSWYMGMFQLPRLAEAMVRENDMALIDRLWSDWSPGFSCPADELRRVKAAIRIDLSAVLGYYRALRSPAALFGESRRLLFSKTQQPAMYLHGADDGCVGVEMCEGVEAAYAGPFEKHIVEGAGHFLHIEKPAVVNALLLAFLDG